MRRRETPGHADDEVNLPLAENLSGLDRGGPFASGPYVIDESWTACDGLLVGSRDGWVLEAVF
jgi:hypothetical protein